jgi:hypothetical protein
MARLTMISLCLFFVAYIILTRADAPTPNESIGNETDGRDNATEFSILGQAPKRINRRPCPEGETRVRNTCRKVL